MFGEHKKVNLGTGRCLNSSVDSSLVIVIHGLAIGFSLAIYTHSNWQGEGGGDKPL